MRISLAFKFGRIVVVAWRNRGCVHSCRLLTWQIQIERVLVWLWADLCGGCRCCIPFKLPLLISSHRLELPSQRIFIHILKTVFGCQTSRFWRKWNGELLGAIKIETGLFSELIWQLMSDMGHILHVETAHRPSTLPLISDLFRADLV